MPRKDKYTGEQMYWVDTRVEGHMKRREMESIVDQTEAEGTADSMNADFQMDMNNLMELTEGVAEVENGEGDEKTET